MSDAHSLRESQRFSSDTRIRGPSRVDMVSWKRVTPNWKASWKVKGQISKTKANIWTKPFRSLRRRKVSPQQKRQLFGPLSQRVLTSLCLYLHLFYSLSARSQALQLPLFLLQKSGHATPQLSLCSRVVKRACCTEEPSPCICNMKFMVTPSSSMFFGM